MSRDYQIVESVLQRFARQFQKNTFNYLYEAELQAALYSEFVPAFDGSNVELNFGDRVGGAAHIMASRVHMEYPGDIRFDIAVIDQSRYDRTRLPWNQEVSVAVEIKYHQAGEGYSRYIDGFRRDLEKLGRLSHQDGVISEVGIAILFLQYAANGQWQDLLSSESIRDIFKTHGNLRGTVVSPTEIVMLP